MNTCYIVGNGRIPEAITPDEKDLVIAADGGYDRLCEIGLGCQLLIGDMDSISSVPEGVEVITHPVRKNYTDTHLAYLEGVKRGYTDFILTGAVGGREDLTLANIALLLAASRAGHDMVLSGESSDMFVITEGGYEIEGEAGKKFSVLAVGGAAIGVSITGSEYDVEEIGISEEFPLGVSNAFRESLVTVEVHHGSVLVVVER